MSDFDSSHRDSSPRILITRLSAIGDCVHTLPLVAALRTKFPSALIAWATQAGGGSLITGTDGLDQVIVVPRNWLKTFGSIAETRRQLRSLRFDTVIDPQSLTKSSLLGWLSGARRRIGFAKGQGRELAPWLNTVLVTPQCDHVVERYLELLRPLGITNPPADFRIPHDSQAAGSVQRFLHDQELAGFALLNPGAGWNSKLWPHARYAAVAQQLRDRCNTRSVVLWAGDQERAWAQEIVEMSNGASVLAPETTLRELAELCRRAGIFVGSDTGPLHLAAAVGTRCVAMFGPTRPEICGPYGSGHVTLQRWYQDGTSAERRGDDNSAMRAIEVDSVVEACESILKVQTKAA